MLTKLFSDISIRSLLSAFLAVVLVMTLALVLKEGKTEEVFFSGYRFDWLTGWKKFMQVLIIPVSAFALNEVLNRQGLLKSSYYIFVLGTINLLAFGGINPSFTTLLSIPFVVFMLLWMLPLISSGEIYNHVFDAGCIIALLSLISPQALWLIIIVWAAVISLGRLSVRTIILPFIGLVAVYFITFCLLYFLGQKQIINYYREEHFLLFLNWSDTRFKNLWLFIPVLLTVIPAMGEYVQAQRKAKVQKLQLLNFFAGAFALSTLSIGLWGVNGDYFFVLAIPITVLQANLMHYLKKWWETDLILLFSLGSMLLALFLN